MKLKIILLLLISTSIQARTEKEMETEMKSLLSEYVGVTQSIIKHNTAKDISKEGLEALLAKRQELSNRLDAVEAEHKKTFGSK
jgi:hypothetical protein